MQRKFLALLVLIPFSLTFANSVDLWFGGQFDGFAWDDVMVVSPGQWVDVPVYAMGNSRDIQIADMMVPLGINKQYVDQYNIENCQLFYPLNEWDVAIFDNLNDEFEEGWSSLSFLGFCQIYSEENPWGHFEVPTRIMSFNIHLVENEELMDQMVTDAIGRGLDPRQGSANMGDILGTGSYEINEHYATLLFSPVGIDDPAAIPDVYFLSDNYPNPFNAATLIKYGLPEDAFVTIDMYDILGRRVETLVSEPQQAGYHQVTLRADELASGMYFFKMQAGDFAETKKMMLLK
jgi:hypothetical protein